MLPLDLTIEDYSTNEKIAYLPHRLADEGREAFSGEAPGMSATTRPGAIWCSIMRPIAIRAASSVSAA